MLELFHRSGYSGQEALTVGEIEHYLRDHPELIDSWLLESQDTRASAAWYFMKPREQSQTWIVGFCPGTESHEFSDKYRACAVYIDKFIENLGLHQGSIG